MADSDGDPNLKLERVLTTTDSTLLPVVKSVLESASIPFLVQGEGAQGLFPMAAAPTGQNKTGLGARIMVPQNRAAEARELLATFTETPEDPDTDTE